MRFANPRDEAGATPKLDIATIDEALGLLDCIAIVGANQRLKSYEMPVVPNGIGPVFRHAPPSRFSMAEDYCRADGSSRLGFDHHFFLQREIVNCRRDMQRSDQNKLMIKTAHEKSP